MGVENIKTFGRKGASVADTHKRLTGIVEKVLAFVDSGDEAVDLVVIEGPAFSSRLGSPHDRSGLWWMVISAIRDTYGTPVAVVAPASRAKYATGDGRADKETVMAFAIERYTSKTVRITNDDIADATVLAAMGSRRLGVPAEPKHLEGSVSLTPMEAVAWPV